MRLAEMFSLQCWACRREIEIPCPPPHHCPDCGARLAIEWRPARPGILQRLVQLFRNAIQVNLPGGSHASRD